MEESDDKETRTYWVRVTRPSSPSHPSPYEEVTQQPEIFRRDIKDIVLLMRREELGDDFTGNIFDTKVENVDKVVETEDSVEHQDHEDAHDVVQEPSENQKRNTLENTLVLSMHLSLPDIKSKICRLT